MAEDVTVSPSAEANGQVEEFRLSFDDMTLDECEQVEEKTGKTIGELFPRGGLSTQGIRGLYWISRRRHEPGFTWEEAGEQKLTAMVDAIVSGDE